jgi:hypothetical protein
MLPRCLKLSILGLPLISSLFLGLSRASDDLTKLGNNTIEQVSVRTVIFVGYSIAQGMVEIENKTSSTRSISAHIPVMILHKRAALSFLLFSDSAITHTFAIRSVYRPRPSESVRRH